MNDQKTPESEIYLVAHDPAAVCDILGQWLRFAEMQVHTLAALGHEITRTSMLVEDSAIELSQKFHGLVGMLEQHSRDDNTSFAVVSGKGAGLLGCSDEAFSETQQCGTSVSSTIGEMIIGMQYQDRAKQQLEHVIDSLNIMSVGLDELTSRTRMVAPGVVPSQSIDWFDHLLSRFTLSELRERFVRRMMQEGFVMVDKNTPPSATELENKIADDIVLF